MKYKISRFARNASELFLRHLQNTGSLLRRDDNIWGVEKGKVSRCARKSGVLFLDAYFGILLVLRSFSEGGASSVPDAFTPGIP